MIRYKVQCIALSGELAPASPITCTENVKKCVRIAGITRFSLYDGLRQLFKY